MARDEPTTESVLRFLEPYITALTREDLETITGKTIRKRIKEELGAEVGVHYEKAWLGEQIERLLRASAPANPEPIAESHNQPPPSDDVSPAPALPEDNGTASVPAAPPPVIYPVGTVLWAKVRGFSYWPAMVFSARKTKQHRHQAAGGAHFVKFFGTNQYAYVEGVLLQQWESYREKGERDAKRANKGKQQLTRDFKLGMQEAEAELASPSHLEEFLPGDDDDDDDDDDEAVAAEDQADDNNDDDAKPKKKAPKGGSKGSSSKAKGGKAKASGKGKAASSKATPKPAAADSSDEEDQAIGAGSSPMPPKASKSKKAAAGKPAKVATAADSSDEEAARPNGAADASGDGEEDEAAAAAARAKAEAKAARKAAKKAAKMAANR